jgi:hypothetical protein
MIWPILQALMTLALVATILSFTNFIDRFGRIFFTFIAAFTWFFVGLSMFKIRFMAGGSNAMVFYDFTLGTQATGSGIVWWCGGIGFILLVLGIIRAFDFQYQPVIDMTQEYFGNKKRGQYSEVFEGQ